MKSLLRFIPLTLLLLIWTLPAAAQDGQCVEVWEYWSDYTRHEVNLDTGQVTSYETPDPFAGFGRVDSPDGRYSAEIESDQNTQDNELVLTDFDRGMSVSLAENAGSPVWSPESSRLAYIQGDSDTLSLTLYSLDTGERTSIDLPENDWYTRDVLWSPDGSLIAVVGVVDQADGRSQVRLYSASDLTLTNTFETTLTEASVEWSPSGRYLAAYGSNGEVALIDVVSDEVYILPLDGVAHYRFRWFPGESFLLMEHVYSDLNDEIYVVNSQGELVLQHVLISSYEWSSDDHLVVSVWTLSGLNDLTLFNLQTNQQWVIRHNSGLYAVSSDGRYLAVHVPNLIQFFDLSLNRISPVKIISIREPFGHFIWRSDHVELISLFPDRSLHGYDFETSEWRLIAIIPGEERWLRNVPCAH